MVEKLFRSAPYLTELDATVTSSEGDTITLDRTIFFAFSGGQASDEGTIGNVKVLEAEEQDGEIYYKLEKNEFKPGDSVTVTIDWERRLRLMRLHTAAHLVYEAFVELAGKKKVIGSNVAEDKARLDFELEGSIGDFLPQVKEKVDGWIAQGLEVRRYPDSTYADKWWFAFGDRKMPCGGTHVQKTSEIGAIALKRKNLGAGKERIEVTLV